MTAGYPRPVRTIHQIEVTSRCNLRCKYCPSPKQERLRGQAAMDMTMPMYERALEWAVELNGRYQPEVDLTAGKVFGGDMPMAELSLTGVGEALLHPDFPLMVRLAREALPYAPIVFSTNGILLDEAMCEALAPYQPRIYVSLHRPEKAAFALNNARKYGLLAGDNVSAATSSFDWAGLLDWPTTAPAIPCEFLRSGWAVVLVDGRITTCCLDAGANAVVGHVDDPVESLATTPGAGLAPWGDEKVGCTACHMTVPELVAA